MELGWERFLLLLLAVGSDVALLSADVCPKARWATASSFAASDAYGHG
jgi:hypothetical protein